MLTEATPTAPIDVRQQQAAYVGGCALGPLSTLSIRLVTRWLRKSRAVWCEFRSICGDDHAVAVVPLVLNPVFETMTGEAPASFSLFPNSDDRRI